MAAKKKTERAPETADDIISKRDKERRALERREVRKVEDPAAKVTAIGVKLLGEPRKYGDELTADELAMIRPQVVDALKSQGIIEVFDDNAVGAIADLTEKVDALSAKVDDLIAAISKKE